jgi:two-component system heavy metal sensor histidine kinase CusS
VKPLSLTARISLLFAVVVAVVLLVTGVLIARAVEHHFAMEDDADMRGKLELVQHILAKSHQPSDLDALAGELDDSLVGHEGLSVAVIDARGRTWFASSGSAFPKYLVDTPGIVPGSLQQWTVGAAAYRGIITPVVVDGKRFQVAISVDINHHLVFMAKFRRILAIAMLFAALTTAALGWAATHSGLLPLRRITLLAASVSADRLSERLPETHVPAEILGLSQAFNAMLDRLQDAFRKLTDFSSDIAHELRTPISNLMTQTQVTLAKARSAEEYKEALESGMEEYERLAHMIGDMLFLAQADNNMLIPNRDAIDLGTR